MFLSIRNRTNPYVTALGWASRHFKCSKGCHSGKKIVSTVLSKYCTEGWDKR